MRLDPTRPFTRQDALAAGITPEQLRSARFRALHTGVYVRSDLPCTPAVYARAALLPFPPSAFVSHATAARLQGIPIPPLPEEHVSVVDARDRRRRDGVVCHLAPNAPVQSLSGVRASAVEQTFLELACQLSLVDLVVVGDHMVRRGLVSATGLRRFCGRARGSGARLARVAAGYVRERVDSPMESRVRMLIVLAGLPEPRVNITVGDAHGSGRRRYDLCWPEVKLIVEYDGRHHIERIEQWRSDLARRERIDDDHWRIIVLTAGDIYTTPGATVAKIHHLLRERRHPTVPARVGYGWERHFPGRSQPA